MKKTLTATSLSGLAASMAAAETNPRANREYYELRLYSFQPGQDTGKVEAYLREAFLPALGRARIRPVGVLKPADQGQAESIYLLIPYPAIESFASLPHRLERDSDYQSAAADYLNAPKAAPAYDRFESWLMLAFSGLPKLELPPYHRNPERIYELRTYESPNEHKAQKKIEMFNKEEIGIMRRVRMGPVFYGQKLIGPRLPNLTYMLSAENRDAHKEHWRAFGKDPDWKRIKDLPEYADTVSKISNVFLKPADCSQL